MHGVIQPKAARITEGRGEAAFKEARVHESSPDYNVTFIRQNENCSKTTGGLTLG